MSALMLILLAQVSSPIGEGVCVPVLAAFDPSQVGASIEGVGGYCSLSGCTLSGPFTARNTISLKHTGATGLDCVWKVNTDNNFAYFSCNTRVSGNFYADGNITNGAGNGLTTGTAGNDTTGPSLATTYFRSRGVATGSLPTCNAGQAGSIEYDTTQSCMSECNGSSWACLQRGNAITLSAPFLFVNGDCGTGACSEDVNFDPPAFYSKAQPSAGSTIHAGSFACEWTTAGTGGTTGVVVKLYDVTSAADVCSCTLGSCTTATTTALTCDCDTDIAQATFVAKVYAIRLKNTTDCAVNPTFVHCSLSAAYRP